MKERYEGAVNVDRLNKIAGASAKVAPNSTPTVVVIGSPELTIGLSGLTVTISNFVTKYRSCGKGFCS